MVDASACNCNCDRLRTRARTLKFSVRVERNTHASPACPDGHLRGKHRGTKDTAARTAIYMVRLDLLIDAPRFEFGRLKLEPPGCGGGGRERENERSVSGMVIVSKRLPHMVCILRKGNATS